MYADSSSVCLSACSNCPNDRDIRHAGRSSQEEDQETWTSATSLILPLLPHRIPLPLHALALTLTLLAVFCCSLLYVRLSLADSGLA